METQSIEVFLQYYTATHKIPKLPSMQHSNLSPPNAKPFHIPATALKVKSTHSRGIRIKLVLVAIGLGRHSSVLLLAAEVLLDHVKHLLINLYILMRLQKFYFVQT